MGIKIGKGLKYYAYRIKDSNHQAYEIGVKRKGKLSGETFSKPLRIIALYKPSNDHPASYLVRLMGKKFLNSLIAVEGCSISDESLQFGLHFNSASAV